MNCIACNLLHMLTFPGLPLQMSHMQITWVLELSERRRPPARRGTFSSFSGRRRDRRITHLFVRPLLNTSAGAGCSGAGELDDDMLLRLHPVPGEPGEVARFTAGKRRRRGGRRRSSSSVLTAPGTAACSCPAPRSVHLHDSG